MTQLAKTDESSAVPADVEPEIGSPFIAILLVYAPIRLIGDLVWPGGRDLIRAIGLALAFLVWRWRSGGANLKEVVVPAASVFLIDIAAAVIWGLVRAAWR